MKTIKMTYFAALREATGFSEEQIESAKNTPAELYEELKNRFGWGLDVSLVMAAANDSYVSMDYQIKDGDQITFIPPVSGG